MTSLPLRLILAIAIVALLAAAPGTGLTMSSQAQQGGPDQGQGQGPGNTPSGNPQNESGAGHNESQGQQSSSQQQPGPPEDRPGAQPDPDQRPVDPVAIRDHATGFRTEPPAGSLRPEIHVDAANATASVQRSDVHPMQLRLDSIVEFIDEDKNGAYDLGEPVIGRIPLRDAPFQVNVDTANETRDIVYPLEDNGHLTLRFHLGNPHTADEGAKFDVILEGFPFQQNGTLVALGMRVDTPAGLQTADVHGEPALIGQAGDHVPYLSWEREVIADGASHTVGASIHLSTSSEQTTGQTTGQNAIMYWAYPQAEAILHDPVLGVTEAIQDLAGELLPYIAAMAATAGLLAIGYTARRRRRL